MNEKDKLIQRIQSNPDDADAWAGLAILMDDPARKKDCLRQLERILAFEKNIAGGSPPDSSSVILGVIHRTIDSQNQEMTNVRKDLGVPPAPGIPSKYQEDVLGKIQETVARYINNIKWEAEPIAQIIGLIIFILIGTIFLFYFLPLTFQMILTILYGTKNIYTSVFLLVISGILDLTILWAGASACKTVVQYFFSKEGS